MAEYGSLRRFLGLLPSPMVTSRARSGREGEKAKREQSKDRAESEGDEKERESSVDDDEMNREGRESEDYGVLKESDGGGEDDGEGDEAKKESYGCEMEK